MSYQYLCPQCGRGFLEGTNHVNCPQCGVPLEHTAHGPSADEAGAHHPAALDGLQRTTRVLNIKTSAKTTNLGRVSPDMAAAFMSDKLPEHLDIDELLRKV